MTFSFSAIGTKEEVKAQLAKVEVYGNSVGEQARLLALNSIAEDTAQPHSDSYEVKYTVAASGHSGGGSPLSLNFSISSVFVPKVVLPAETSPPGGPRVA